MRKTFKPMPFSRRLATGICFPLCPCFSFCATKRGRGWMERRRNEQKKMLLRAAIDEFSKFCRFKIAQNCLFRRLVSQLRFGHFEDCFRFWVRFLGERDLKVFFFFIVSTYLSALSHLPTSKLWTDVSKPISVDLRFSLSVASLISFKYISADKRLNGVESVAGSFPNGPFKIQTCTVVNTLSRRASSIFMFLVFFPSISRRLVYCERSERKKKKMPSMPSIQMLTTWILHWSSLNQMLLACLACCMKASVRSVEGKKLHSHTNTRTQR